MLRKTLLLLSIVGSFCGCDFQNMERARLKSKVDALAAELEVSREAISALGDVRRLIDSIDYNRYAILGVMKEEITDDDFKARLRGINRYVIEAQDRIRLLQQKIDGLSTTSSKSTETLKGLIAAVDQRTEELRLLEERFEAAHSENDKLFQTVTLKEAELGEKLERLKAKEDDLEAVENELKNSLMQFRAAQGESYFAEAMAMEEIANRTHFAPGKRREARSEAYDLYKLALSYGKEEARDKMVELEQEMQPLVAIKNDALAPVKYQKR